MSQKYYPRNYTAVRSKFRCHIRDLPSRRSRRKCTQSQTTAIDITTDIRNSNMAAKTGNTNISGTMTGRIEILTANLEFFDHDEFDKSIPVSKQLRQRMTPRNVNIAAWRQSCNFRLSVVVPVTCDTFVKLVMVANPEFCRWNFDVICRSSEDISYFWLAIWMAIGQIAISGRRNHRLTKLPQVCRWKTTHISFFSN